MPELTSVAHRASRGLTPESVLVDVEALHHLAGLLRGRNALDAQIAELIERPALPGHLGEWIASRIFDIELSESAVTKGIDGVFRGAPMAGASVNVKLYGKRQGLLDLLEDASADFYLVLTGPLAQPVSSRGTHRPVCIHNVYLFETPGLLVQLRERGVKIGVGTSVRVGDWNAAEIYPEAKNSLLPLTDAQRYTLGLFRDKLPDPAPRHNAPARGADPSPSVDGVPSGPHAWSEMSRGERRQLALDAVQEALASRGFSVMRRTEGGGVVFDASKGQRRLEIHPSASTGAGPAYWRKTRLRLAESCFACLVLLDENEPPSIYLIPSLSWQQPDGILVDRTYVGSQSEPEWGINFSPATRPALQQYTLNATLGSL